MKYYAGIGSRQAPPDILLLMTEVAKSLKAQGYVLRSGGAPGSDSAFEAGVPEKNKKEIYLPWKGFNGNPSTLYRVTDEALALAGQFHPVWDRLPYGARKLMGRNCYQILGKDLKTPVDFVLCWTKNGKELGGTAEAMRLAASRSIPVFNLYFAEIQDKMKKWMDSGVSL